MTTDYDQPHPELARVCKQIVSHLNRGGSMAGERWVFKSMYYHLAHIERTAPADQRVTLSVYVDRLFHDTKDLSGRKLELSGIYLPNIFGEQYFDYERDLPHLKISATRKPEDIAREIVRFSAQVLEATQKNREWERQIREDHKRRTKQIERFAKKMCGTAKPKSGRNEVYTAHSGYWTGGVSCTVKGGYQDQYQILMDSLPVDLVLKLVTVVGAHNRELMEARNERAKEAEQNV